MNTRVMLAFLERDFLINISYRLAFVMQIAGIFLGVTIFFFISRIFGAAAIPILADYGGNYFAFVLIGVTFSDYLAVGLGSLASTIRNGQVTGTLEVMLVTPTRLSTILVSSSLWSFIFPTLRVAVFLLFGALVFGMDLSHTNVVSSLVVLLVSIVCFTGFGLVSASFVMVFKQGDLLSAVITTLSGLFGGTLYPTEVLPAPLQVISSLLPLTYSLRAIRLAVLQGYGLDQLQGDLFALVLFTLILVPMGFVCFGFAVGRAKMDGSLAQY